MDAGVWVRPWAAALVMLGGCGPIQTTSALSEARAEVAAATRVQADTQAPYTYQLAQAYLAKAQEEQVRSNYQDAVSFAHMALACAQTAVLEAGGAVAQPTTKAECSPPYFVPKSYGTGTSTTTATSTTARQVVP